MREMPAWKTMPLRVDYMFVSTQLFIYINIYIYIYYMREFDWIGQQHRAGAIARENVMKSNPQLLTTLVGISPMSYSIPKPSI